MKQKTPENIYALVNPEAQTKQYYSKPKEASQEDIELDHEINRRLNTKGKII